MISRKKYDIIYKKFLEWKRTNQTEEDVYNKMIGRFLLLNYPNEANGYLEYESRLTSKPLAYEPISKDFFLQRRYIRLGNESVSIGEINMDLNGIETALLDDLGKIAIRLQDAILYLEQEEIYDIVQHFSHLVSLRRTNLLAILNLNNSTPTPRLPKSKGDSNLKSIEIKIPEEFKSWDARPVENAGRLPGVRSTNEVESLVDLLPELLSQFESFAEQLFHKYEDSIAWLKEVEKELVAVGEIMDKDERLYPEFYALFRPEHKDKIEKVIAVLKELGWIDDSEIWCDDYKFIGAVCDALKNELAYIVSKGIKGTDEILFDRFRIRFQRVRREGAIKSYEKPKQMFLSRMK